MESLRSRHERAPEELTPEIDQEIVETVREVRRQRRQRDAN
ncbi:hypothetical protein [Variovorax sp. DT-64]